MSSLSSLALHVTSRIILRHVISNTFSSCSEERFIVQFWSCKEGSSSVSSTCDFVVVMSLADLTFPSAWNEVKRDVYVLLFYYMLNCGLSLGNLAVKSLI